MSAFEKRLAIEKARDDYDIAINPEASFRSGYDLGYDLKDNDQYQAWFTENISGASFAKLSPEHKQRKWSDTQTLVRLGFNSLSDIISSSYELGKLNDLSPEEEGTVKEAMNRQSLMIRDLEYVNTHLDGDVDAPMDQKGQSMAERWGYDVEDIGGITDFVKAVVANPANAAGMIAGEIVRDMPLALFGAIGLKAVKGTSIASRLIASVNKIQRNSVKNLTKVAAASTAGAIGGGTYEATYSMINKGKLEPDKIIAGTEIGAAFGAMFSSGAIAGAHFLGKKVATPDVPPTATTGVPPTGVPPTGVPTPDVPPTGASAARSSSKLGHPKSIADVGDVHLLSYLRRRGVIDKDTLDVNAILDDILSPEDLAEVRAFSKSILDENRLFPDLDTDTYTTVTRSDVPALEKKLGISILPDKREGRGESMYIKDVDNYSYIIVDPIAFKKQHAAVKKRGGSEGIFDYTKMTGNTLKYVNDFTSHYAFNIAYAKAKIISNRITNKEGVEVPPERLAQEELNRIYREHKFSSASKGEAAADAHVQAQQAQQPQQARQQGREVDDYTYPGFEEEQAVNRRPPTPPEGSATTSPSTPPVLSKTLRDHPYKIAIAGATGAYIYREEDDAFYMAAAVALGVLGANPVHSAVVSMIPSISPDLARLKVLMSKGDATWRNSAKAMEVKSYILGKEISSEFPEGTGTEFLDAVENVSKYNALSDNKKALVDAWKSTYAAIFNAAKDAGLKFQNAADLSMFVDGYVPHIILGKKVGDVVTAYRDLPEADIKAAKEAFSKKLLDKSTTIKGSTASVYSNIRKLDLTMAGLRDKGFIFLESPADILNTYTRSLSRAVHAKRLLNEFTTSYIDIDGIVAPTAFVNKRAMASFIDSISDKLITKESRTVFEQHYSNMNDAPSVTGMLINKSYQDLLRDYFNVSQGSSAKGMLNAILRFNNSLKRISTTGSLFHANSLVSSGGFSFGLPHVFRAFSKKGKVTDDINWTDAHPDSKEYSKLAEEPLRNGLNIIYVPDDPLQNAGKAEVNALFDKLGAFGILSKKVTGKLDDITWNYIHDYFKVAGYYIQKEKLMKRGVPEEQAIKEAVDFNNHAFGGQDWGRFHTAFLEYVQKHPDTFRGKIADTVASQLHPSRRKYLNLYLFSPDWTVSNIRSIGHAFLGKNGSHKALAYRVFKRHWKTPEEKALVDVWKMYAEYAGRSGMITSMYWWAATEIFSDKEPTMDGLAKFWRDGQVDLGNKTGMTVSKQTAETMHWVTHPGHTLINKLSVIPRSVMELWFQKQYIGLKREGGSVTGPTIKAGKYMISKGTPISVQPFLDESIPLEERVKRFFFGFSGLPIRYYDEK